jgi:uncharacterized membrane protein YfbV (UPF0208 family)
MNGPLERVRPVEQRAVRMACYARAMPTVAIVTIADTRQPKLMCLCAPTKCAKDA